MRIWNRLRRLFLHLLIFTFRFLLLKLMV